MQKKNLLVKICAGIIVLILVYFGGKFAFKVKKWKELDATYSESFQTPKIIAPGLKGKKVLFHIKTGLDQDDSQICVGFNIIFGALRADAKVTILFDAGAVLDLTEKRHNLSSTKVPLRLKKVIANQMNLPLNNMPNNYKEYLFILNKYGAKVFANTAMNVVTGYSDKVQKKFNNYEFIKPVTYTGIAKLFSEAGLVISY